MVSILMRIQAMSNAAKVTTVEQTGEKYKAWQFIGVVMMCIGDVSYMSHDYGLLATPLL